jgi:hypothetical protein
VTVTPHEPAEPASSVPEVEDSQRPAAMPDTRTSGHFGLAPYQSWSPRLLPDPLTASLDEVLAGLYDIIATEGPMPCSRAYLLYLSSIGADGMGPRMRSIFNKAVYRGIQQRRLLDRNEHGTPGQIDNIVRITRTPPVVLRERGDRTLDEIPPSEVAAAIQSLAEATGRVLPDDIDDILNDLLLRYGLERHPSSDWQSRILHRAIALMVPESSEVTKQQLSLFRQFDDC